MNKYYNQYEIVYVKKIPDNQMKKNNISNIEDEGN